MTITAVAKMVVAGTLLLSLIFAKPLTIVLMLSDTLQSVHVLLQIYQAFTTLQALSILYISFNVFYPITL